MRTIRITSRTSSTVRHFLDIKKHASATQFLVEGARFVRELDPNTITEIAVTCPQKHKDFLSALHHAKIYEVTEEVMQKLCEAVSGQEMICITSKQNVPKPDRLLLLDGVQDPGNVGTIIRTAYAFGFGVMLSANSANPYTPKIVSSTAGTVSKCYVERCDLALEIEHLKENGYRIIASVLEHGAKPPEQLQAEKVAIVIGNEGNGVSSQIKEKADDLCYIPMQNTCDSLNAAIAAGILAYMFA